MVKLNEKISNSLDIDHPEDSEEQSGTDIVVYPHELPDDLGNNDLPSMRDIDIKTIEGEKQLDVIIEKSMKMFEEFYSELPTIEPKYRNRHMELTNSILENVIDAIKHKTEYQLKKKDMRMKETNFVRTSKSESPLGSGGTTNNNFFVGSREELLETLNNMQKSQNTDGDK